MRRLLTVTAGIELGAGLALLAVPSPVAALLLGEPLAVSAVPLGRLSGAALLTLGVAAWLARHDDGAAARVVVSAMAVYNLGAAAVLGAACVQLPTPGALLWGAVALHTAMGLWCLVCLRGGPPARSAEHR